jgi:multidrug resistance efflux pump
MYTNAKAQLDGMVAIEKTMKEAQQAYETLSKFDLNKAIESMQKGGNMGSFAALRSQIANTEGHISQNVNFVEGNAQRVSQLENLELIRTAAVKNGTQSSGKINANTAAQITAQNSSMQLALQAAEDQRRLKEEADKERAAKANSDNFRDSKKIYEVIGK